MISARRLREVVIYDPTTGLMTARVDRGSRVRAGQPLGARHGCGYLNIQIDGRLYMVHRLGWLYVHGAWPKGDIDHINGVRDDNRIENLRDVTRSINCQNQRRAQASSRTGLLGVSIDKAKRNRPSPYVAAISYGGRTHYIGAFKTPELAHAAYLAEKRRIHPGTTI